MIVASERFDDKDTVETIRTLINLSETVSGIPLLFDKIARVALRAAGVKNHLDAAVYIRIGRDSCCDGRPEGVDISVKLTTGKI